MPDLDPTTLIASGQFVCFIDIPGYAASSEGTLWSCWKHGHGVLTETWRPLKTRVHKGHVTITLGQRWNAKTYQVGSLILRAFAGACPPGLECCHNNGDPLNNCIENLRWDTHRENGQDMIRHGRCRKSEQPDAIIQGAIARVQAGETQRVVARSLGVSQSVISDWLRGKPHRTRRNHSADVVQEAIARAEAGETHRTIAQDLGICTALISNWRNGKHLPKPL